MILLKKHEVNRLTIECDSIHFIGILSCYNIE